MSKFIWSEDYSVGNPMMDDHHMHLIQYFNDAYESLTDTSDSEKTRQLLSKLTSYAVSHFSQEENLMRLASYVDYDAHLNEHKEFVRKILTFKSDFANNQNDLNEELFLFLFDWLTHHILTVDKKYASVIAGL